MSESVNPVYTSVPTPTTDTTALMNTCIALKMNVDSLTRQRGGSDVWAATVQEVAAETNSGGQPTVSVSYLRGLVDQATMLVASVSQQMGLKINRSGDTMGGQLTLQSNPTEPLHAATKGYVDQIGLTDWDEIPNKPVAFPPKPHGHTIFDIEGLSGYLDDLSLADHDHEWTVLRPPAGTTPVVGHVLAWSGTEIRLVAPPSGGGAGLAIGDTPPASPGLFPFWFDTVRGMLMVWYNDGNSIQWIPSATGASGPPGPAGNGTLNGARVPLATDGRAGDFWINTLDWVTYGPKGVDGTWPLGVAMRRGGMALTIAGERVQITGFNVEMS